ncbi:MAG: 30S ribosomal protein S6e [Thermoplasmata archaeon]|nr:MAG: 30S ribosomal protein S6e [Thermoplasmata archaeon]
MVEFKANISDPKTGKTYQTVVSGHYANSLVVKRIGEEFDGIFVSLPGFKLVLTGGSDKDGFPIRPDLPGQRRKKVLVSKSLGFRPKDKGVRRRKTLRGNIISPDIVQINMKITTHGSKKVEELLKSTEESK